MLTIDGFWKRRFSGIRQVDAAFEPGWSYVESGLEFFKEAPLESSSLLEGDNPDDSRLILVSTPGAVGKTTLSQEIAFHTNAVYVDLAKADPVGGNSISGGLAKAGLFSAFQSGEVAILIDGLDEARLKVTQASFDAFLKDVDAIARMGTKPIAIFGRTGAIGDAWLGFSSLGSPNSVVEIGYYDRDAAIEFAVARMRHLTDDMSHDAVRVEAITRLVDALISQTESDGDRFAGYAPVLAAVAERVARATNPAGLVAQIAQGDQPITLTTVLASILDREQQKLDQLDLSDSTLKRTLYSLDEQMHRLAAQVYRASPPPVSDMTNSDAQLYGEALQTWVPEHPFLDGNNNPSNSVFDAAISAWSLKSKELEDLALTQEISKGIAANPFLSEFYVGDSSNHLFIPPSHIGVIYASIRARLAVGDTANLTIEGIEADDETALRAEVEISLQRLGTEKPRLFSFQSDQTGVIELGCYVEDVSIDTPYATVAVGPGPEGLLVGPVSLSCDSLRLSVSRLIVEGYNKTDNSVYLQAKSVDSTSISAPPTIRGDGTLSVAWLSNKNHPWTNFAVTPTISDNPKIDEGLRRLTKFIMSFRSHSKGSLARYKAKLDHARMRKGSGQAILDKLISDGIVKADGAMYVLEPMVLGEKAGASYQNAVRRQYGADAVRWVGSAVGES